MVETSYDFEEFSNNVIGRMSDIVEATGVGLDLTVA